MKQIFLVLAFLTCASASGGEECEITTKRYCEIRIKEVERAMHEILSIGEGRQLSNGEIQSLFYLLGQKIAYEDVIYIQ